MPRYVIEASLWLLCAVWAATYSQSAIAADLTKGERIYRSLCASCHGAEGEGTDKHYSRPLIGERPLADLAQVIAKTMPEDDPGKCVGEDAQQVAAYIYESFYAPAAQAHNRPPRLELSRLTVRQYRQAVADLLGSFRGSGQRDEQRGLKAEYFKSRQFRNDHRVLERLDPVVNFDFGESSPEPGKIEPAEFAMRWQGAVLAPETGEYEFTVHTENAARLWVNAQDRPLIDAWVRSGSDTEHRGTILLLGGRIYPLRLEFFKSKEGKEKRASIGLLWRPPRQAVDVIPQRLLTPQRFPEVFVLQTPFPPDDRTAGYERGTAISKAWEQATTAAALEVAGYVAAHLQELSGVPHEAAERTVRLREFAGRLTERAVRRPLSAEQRQFFVDRQFAATPDPELALKRTLLLVLKSPRFLYREPEGPPGDAHHVAARIAMSLWDSLPDQPLREAAGAGQLTTREQVLQQATRLLPDLRTRAKLREFCLQWLKVEQIPDISKDPQRFPDFNATLASDLRTSLDLFLDEILSSPTADFRQLWLADSVYLNGRLAKFYGVPLPAEAPFQKVVWEPAERAGLLSHPYLLADFAYTAASSPIHRGVFLARNVLGRSLRPPPAAVAPLAPDLQPDLTTRERVALQTKPDACQTCHSLINPLGFTLERFDAVGRLRHQEQGRPVDASGSYLTPRGESVKFTGARELANYLAQSDETHTAFVDQLFHYLIKQPIRAYGLRERQRLQQAFARDQFNIRKLAVEITATAALPPSPTPAAP